MRAGIEPGRAAGEGLDAQPAALQVDAVDVGDLELPARRWPDRLRDGHHLVVVEIQPRHGVVRLRVPGLFLDVDGAVLGIEADHAVALGVLHVIGEHRGAVGLERGRLQFPAQPAAVEDVVAEHETDRPVAHELLADQESLCQAARLGLHRVDQLQAPLRTVAQQLAECVLVARRGDDQDLADAGEHQRRQRVVDHRLVVDRHQLLADRAGERVQACAAAAREHDAAVIRLLHEPGSFLCGAGREYRGRTITIPPAKSRGMDFRGDAQ